MVGSTELESVTSCVSSRRSNQLSYEPGVSFHYITHPPKLDDADQVMQTNEVRQPPDLFLVMESR